MEEKIIKIKKEVLQFLKDNPKLVKSVIYFNNTLFFFIDEDDVDESKIIREKFKDVNIITLDFLIENLYEGNHLYIKLINYGEIIFDLGIITSLRKLVQKGKIKPSKEAIYHSFLNSIKLKEEAEKLGKTVVAKMFWSLYYLLQSYFMIEGKYLTPEEINNTLKFYANANKIDEKIYLLYNALYNLYYNLHQYNFEEFEFLFGQFNSTYNELKDYVEKMSKNHLRKKKS